MILEALVATTCSYGYCNEALNSYYFYNPVFKERAEEIVFYVEKSLHTDIKE